MTESRRKRGKRKRRGEVTNPDRDYTAVTTVSLRLREGGMLFLALLGLFTLLALATFNPTDAENIQNISHVEVSNSAGWAGAWSSRWLFALLGVVAWWVPMLLLAKAVLVYRLRYSDWGGRSTLFILRTLGLVTVLFSGAALAALHLGQFGMHLPELSGGLAGSLMAAQLRPVLGMAGSTMLLLALFSLGLGLYTRLSWFFVIELLFLLLRRLVGWIGKASIWAIEGLQHRFRGWKLAREARKEQASDAEDEACWEEIPAPAAEPVVPVVVLSPPAKQPSKPLSSLVPMRKKIVPDDGTLPEGELPGVALLDKIQKHTGQKSSGEYEKISRLLESKLADFGVKAVVVAVHPGPVITRYEIQPAPGTKASKISGLARDLARSLAVVSVRVVEVIPGKSVMGIEIPNDDRQTVFFAELIDSVPFKKSASPISLCLGHDIAGQPVVVDLAKMPHLLVAGTTGSGKSVGVNAMLLSMLFKSGPENVRLIMIDPKMLELSVYDGIPHLLSPVVTDMKEAANALRWCVAEMERRYRLMAVLGVRNIAGYNARIKEAADSGEPLLDPFYESVSEEDPAPILEHLPFIVVVVDEFADMMMIVGKKVEELIARIAQKARAAGIHLILATQRPSVDVITGLIKANVPTRISFQVSSKIDSRTIIDQGGAEQLLGHGDMLYLPPGTSVPIRVHGAFVSDEEVHRVVADWQKRGVPDYVEDVLSGGSESAAAEGSALSGGLDGDSEQDPLFDEAVAFVTESRRASISSVQRKLKIGYNRAARMIEAMESAGVVTPAGHNGNREVIAPPPVKD